MTSVAVTRTPFSHKFVRASLQCEVPQKGVFWEGEVIRLNVCCGGSLSSQSYVPAPKGKILLRLPSGSGKIISGKRQF